MGLIYKATCLINDKIYIGQTTRLLHERVRDHLKNLHREYNNKFYNAILKHGSNNFKWEIIEDNISNENLSEREIYYIVLYNSFKEGYNSTSGGEHCTISFDAKERISKTHKGKIISEEVRIKISKTRKERGSSLGDRNPMFGKKGELSPHYGKSLTQEHKDKISESHKGKKKPYVSITHKNKIVSEETLKKMSESGKKRCHTRDASGRFVKKL